MSDSFVKYQILYEKQLIVTEYHGLLTRDLLDQHRTSVRDLVGNVKRFSTIDVLSHLRDFDMSNQDIVMMAFGSVIEPGVKRAFVAQTAAQHLLAAKYSQASGLCNYHFKTFSDLDTAQDWVSRSI